MPSDRISLRGLPPLPWTPDDLTAATVVGRDDAPLCGAARDDAQPLGHPVASRSLATVSWWGLREGVLTSLYNPALPLIRYELK